MTQKIEKISKLKVFYEGVYESLAICLSFFFMFGATGSLYHQHGIPFTQTLLTSVLVFTTPLQIYLLHFPDHHMVLFAIVASVVINSRFFMMATVIVPYFKHIPKKKLLPALSIFSASSFTVTYTYAKSMENPPYVFIYFLGVAIPAFIVAQISLCLGYFFLKKISSPIIPLIFIIVLPVHFTALTAKRSHMKGILLATLAGFCMGPFLESLNDAMLGLIIPIIFGFLLALYMHLTKKDNKRHA